MKIIALILSGNVIGLALWDGVSVWNPIAPGLCDTTVDVTSNAAVQPGSSYSGPTGWLATGGTFAPQ
jgi:hypothetical protein